MRTISEHYQLSKLFVVKTVFKPTQLEAAQIFQEIKFEISFKTIN